MVCTENIFDMGIENIDVKEITDKVARNAKISLEHLRNEKKNENSNQQIPSESTGTATGSESDQDSDQEMISRVQHINRKIKNGMTHIVDSMSHKLWVITSDSGEYENEYNSLPVENESFVDQNPFEIEVQGQKHLFINLETPKSPGKSLWIIVYDS